MTATFKQRVSAAAHEQLAQANPLTLAQGAQLLGHLLQRSPDTLLDIGCGPAFLSTALVRQQPTRVTAVEPNPLFLARAKTTLADGTPPTGVIEFICSTFAEQSFDQHFDAVVCIGASQAIGNPREALQRCRALLTDDGLVIFAELTWRQPPAPALLDFLGVPEDFYWQQDEGSDVLIAAGLHPIATYETSTAAYQDYEDQVLKGRQEFAETLPASERDALLRQSGAWYDMYQRHGRATFGFTAHVARPQHPAD